MIERCRNMIIKRQSILEYVKTNFKKLSVTADSEFIKKYSHKVSGIGPYCPSLINYIIHPNQKKGRLINSNKSFSNYTEFSLDDNFKPLRMRNYNEYGCDLSSYFFTNNGYTYSVPLIGYTDDDYGKSIYMYKTHNNNVIEYAEIDKSFLYWEIYSYPNEDDDYVVCNMYEYTDHSISPIDCRLRNEFIAIVGEKYNLKEKSKEFELKQFRYDILLKKGKPVSIIEHFLSGDTWLMNRIVR